MVAMSAIREPVCVFLAAIRVAVTGVSRDAGGHGRNIVHQRRRERGYTVFAVGPNAQTVEGDLAYITLSSIPGGVEAVVIGTAPQTAQATMLECVELGSHRVWMHRGVGAGSVSPAATEYGRIQGITVIDGGCPLMFHPMSDFAHQCLCLVLSAPGSARGR
jgi:predicted CoA-binding protein